MDEDIEVTEDGSVPSAEVVEEQTYLRDLGYIIERYDE